LPSNQQPIAGHAAFNPLSGPDYPLDEDSYFTDDSGNILMVINVLGQVNKQGPMVVKEKVDFAKILALAGGIKDEANLKQVLVARQEPEQTGKQVYIVDLKKYYNEGDRSSFIALKPNDTIIIPEKGLSLRKVASVFSFVFTGASGVYYLKNM
jgi:protein involved in polysaccharide export with SLBB domain